MQGKVVVITGGFGALGRAAAKIVLEAGAIPVLIDYAPAPAAALFEDVVSVGGADLTNAAAAAAAIETVFKVHSRIDALFNIAGGFVWNAVADGGVDVWEKMFTINTKTAVNASKAALPHLIETGGAIVNVGAHGAVKAGAGFGPYAASKQGVHKLTEALAEEMKGKVRVNAVLPSILDTAPNRKDLPNADFSTWVQPEDLARVMLFLASPAARDITGALIPVTGRV
ncbi:SDR family NAD(P)-dependent oxidoreductase [Candidatus Viadribacter manganicus]|uniref:Short-chain dehydrogenase n=1 Tax=Candidatus Viadribacter manganicus TaxID=1759059 RepID=A0A1B1ALS5_9PROT|nr:SDR family NAD(P)-dependent oxidoreductase [Candidatus Viadribacter manganicus]ANP47516.1 short-chain dehydrogenase [Candidatus Viadribacter manganicus]